MTLSIVFGISLLAWRADALSLGTACVNFNANFTAGKIVGDPGKMLKDGKKIFDTTSKLLTNPDLNINLNVDMVEVADDLASAKTIYQQFKADGTFDTQASKDKKKIALERAKWNELIQKYSTLDVADT